MEQEFSLPDGSSFSLSDSVKALNKYPFSDIRKGVKLTYFN
jgi:hypothetical protein